MKDILNWVGGDPSRSRRKIADGVANALFKAGITASGRADSSGSMYFVETESLPTKSK